MPTNTISCPSINLFISIWSFTLLHAVCSSPKQDAVQYLLLCLFFFTAFICSQGPLTNSIAGSISSTREGVQAGRELPILPCQIWHQASTTVSLPVLLLSVVLWFFDTHMLAQTCSTLQPCSLHRYCFHISPLPTSPVTQTRLYLART